MHKAEIGIIGGSGVYDIQGVQILDEILIETPFGNPSDKITIANIENKNVAFLPRHGKGHFLLPTEIPVKANIYALKKIGVKSIIAISAVGSLKKEIKPMDFIIPNQIIDRTRQRSLSYFGNGIVGHVSLADPFCHNLSEYLYDTIKTSKQVEIHKDETYLCMEGPLFSTKAESHLYRSWNCGIIGMTAIPEAKLAREAEMCYSIIAMSTDYDCWNEEEGVVSIETVLGYMSTNVNKVKSLLGSLIKGYPDRTKCSCQSSAKNTIITDKSKIPQQTKKDLELLYGKYF